MRDDSIRHTESLSHHRQRRKAPPLTPMKDPPSSPPAGPDSSYSPFDRSIAHFRVRDEPHLVALPVHQYAKLGKPGRQGRSLLAPGASRPPGSTAPSSFARRAPRPAQAGVGAAPGATLRHAGARLGVFRQAAKPSCGPGLDSLRPHPHWRTCGRTLRAPGLSDAVARMDVRPIDAIVAVVSAGLVVSVVPRPRAALLASHGVVALPLGRSAPVRELSFVRRTQDADDRNGDAVLAALHAACAAGA